MTEPLCEAVGPLLSIARGYRRVIAGMRWRTSSRALYPIPEGSSVVLRIGPPGSAALVEQALELLDVEGDPSYFATLEPETTLLLPAGAGYEYIYVQVPEELPLLAGPCEVVNRPLPMA